MNINKLKGPILIFGAGGFIGFNLLLQILKKRCDVFGISHNPASNWRFKTKLVPKKNIVECDMTDSIQLTKVFKKIKPKTIFNLAAYGAYSFQNDPQKIYNTNFSATLSSIEIAKQFGFDAYVYAGTSSEYGLNSAAPKEYEELLPNSHYAVSKTATAHLVQYYRLIEKLPMAHLRIYSAYGPWEENKRLIPQIVTHAEKGNFPPLVNPTISRDYVYVDDVVRAFILTALKIHTLKDSIYNIATGKKTTIRELAMIVKTLAKIQQKPVFSTMPNRGWDLTNWYGNAAKFKKTTSWKYDYTIEQGLKKTISWHKKMHLWHQ
jgi:dolichol-phosphate mannosyltransferase